MTIYLVSILTCLLKDTSEREHMLPILPNVFGRGESNRRRAIETISDK
jgi:hypothetical protein